MSFSVLSFSLLLVVIYSSEQKLTKLIYTCASNSMFSGFKSLQSTTNSSGIKYYIIYRNQNYSHLYDIVHVVIQI